MRAAWGFFLAGFGIWRPAFGSAEPVALEPR